MQKIVVISEGFPNPSCPYRYTFLEQVVTGFADLGMEVYVICPVYNNQKQYHFQDSWEYKSKKGITVHVYQPIIRNFSVRRIGLFRLGVLTYKSFRDSVFMTIKNNKIEPDTLYSHFMFPSGCVAAELGCYLGVRSFCACGESDIDAFISPVGERFIANRLGKITGIVSVSSENKRIIQEKNLVKDTPIAIFPNGVDHNIFFPRDKKTCRSKIGIRDTDFVGIFVGGFNENKGVYRVFKAASQVEGLKMIYIGANGDVPVGDNIIFSGSLPHDQIPKYLCASDFFVLPTRAEGCCNAIIEAMACGLPIISSDRPFNYDVLSKDSAILIDPDDIDQIKESIISIMNSDAIRTCLSMKSIEIANKLRIENRVKHIVDFMSESR